MYNLSPTTGSNDILGNQLMQKFWLVAKYTISNLIVEIVEVHLDTKEVPLVLFVWKSYLI
jgi:hypothetical protein